MNRAAALALLFSFALAACHTTEKVAVGTFKVIDAPANYIRHKIDTSDGSTTTTTTTTTSDVSNPGYPVTTTPAPPPTPAPHRTAATTAPAANVTPSRTVTTSNETAKAPTHKVSPTATPHVAPSQPTQFPVARPVPGRPGYVYSIDPNGGMVDVTGYKSGDKAKDPYTKQIFIVP